MSELTETKRHRAKFRPEEDEQLSRLVSLYGEQWEQIAERMPDRNVRQCRERWRHYLSQPSRARPWTEYEDMVLVYQTQTLGFKWSQVAAYLPGRTNLDVKSRWAKVVKQSNAAPIISHPVAQFPLLPPQPAQPQQQLTRQPQQLPQQLLRQPQQLPQPPIQQLQQLPQQLPVQAPPPPAPQLQVPVQPAQLNPAPTITRSFDSLELIIGPDVADTRFDSFACSDEKWSMFW